MLSHVIYEDLDPRWPASLSSVIAEDLLQQAMGFKGITMTDDLDMGAIDKHFDVETVVRRVSGAGIDIALICRDHQKAEEAYEALIKIVRESEDAKKKATASVQRILNLKQKYLLREP